MKKFNVIVADPPWTFGSKSAVNNSSGNEIKKLSEHYKSMSSKDICNLEVRGLTADDCACFMWTTDAHIAEAMDVLKAWGFRYKTIAFVWVKKTSKGNTCYNVAPWTIKSCEICLLGTKGTMSKYKKKNNVEQLVEAERTKHSKKPDEVMKRIEEMFGDVPRLELFCRTPRSGWDAWGDQVDSTITL